MYRKTAADGKGLQIKGSFQYEPAPEAGRAGQGESGQEERCRPVGSVVHCLAHGEVAWGWEVSLSSQTG